MLSSGIRRSKYQGESLIDGSPRNSLISAQIESGTGPFLSVAPSLFSSLENHGDTPAKKEDSNVIERSDESAAR
jgi:hypothetical protein